MSSFQTLVITLFFAINALGVIPEYLKLVQKLSPKKQLWIAVRELLFALVIMIFFYFLGELLFALLGLNRVTIQIAGGIVIFLIAIRLIFPRDEDHVTNKWHEGDPFIVPIATPLMAGPSVLAMIMIYSQEEGRGNLSLIVAIIVAWFISCIVFLLAKPIYKYVGEKVLTAAQRLMGLIITLIAVQMILAGFKSLVHGG